MRTRIRKGLALLLSLSMVLSMVTLGAFADEPEDAMSGDTVIGQAADVPAPQDDANEIDEANETGEGDEVPALTGLAAAVASGATSYTMTDSEEITGAVEIANRDFELDLGGQNLILAIGQLMCVNGNLSIKNGTITRGSRVEDSNGDTAAMVVALNFTGETKNINFENVSFVGVRESGEVNITVEAAGLNGRFDIRMDSCTITGPIAFGYADAELNNCSMDLSGYASKNSVTGALLSDEALFDIENGTLTVNGGNFVGYGNSLFTERRATADGNGKPRNATVIVNSGSFENVEHVADFVAPTAAYNEATGEVEPLTADNAAAEVSGNYYKTLQDAIDAAEDGETVTLLKDGTYAELFPSGNRPNGTYVVDQNDLTIDLGGNTISEIPNDTFMLRGKGITLCNGTLNGAHDDGYTSGVVSYVLEVTGDGSTQTKYLTNLNTLGGIIVSSGTAVLTNVNAVGTDFYAVCAQSGAEAVIVSGEYSKMPLAEGKSYRSNYVLWIGSDNGEAFARNSRMTITGGNFTAAEGGKMVLMSNGVAKVGFIEGGTFNIQPEDKYLAPDLIWGTNEDGKYTPVADERMVFIVANDFDKTVQGRYTTIQEAVNACDNADYTIQIKANIIENVTIPEGKSVKIQTGGQPYNGEAWEYTWTGTVTNNGSIYFEQYSRVDVRVNNNESAVLDYSDSVYSTQQFVGNGQWTAPKWLCTEEDGWYVSGSSSAKIVEEGGTERLYKDAQTAINAANNGETVTLTSTTNANLVIPNGKDITLDLNKQQTRTGNSDDAKAKPVITIDAGAKLTLVDSKGGSSGLCQRSGSSAALIENNGTLIIESGKIDAKNNTNKQTFSGNGTVTVNGGTFTQDIRNLDNVNPGDGLEFAEDGKSVVKAKVAQVGEAKFETLQEAVEAATEGQTITLINDFVVPEGSYVGYVMPKDAVLDLNGHTLTVPFTAAVFEGENVTIQNGRFESTANYSIWIGNGENDTSVTLKNVTSNAGINVFVASVVLEDCSIDASDKQYYAAWADFAADITIKSGTYIGGFQGKNGNGDQVVLHSSAGVNNGEYVGAGKITVEGGSFTGQIWSTKDKVDKDGISHNSETLITGGTFSSDVSEYCAEGYEATENNGVWTVAEETPAPVVTPTTYYNLTVNYVFEDGAQAADSYTTRRASGWNYNVASPEIEGYTADQETVSGRLTRNTTLTVTYTADEPEDLTDQDTPLSELPLPFVDVYADDWYREAVAFVYAKGLFKGVSDTEFAPTANTTRGMVATVFFRLENEPETAFAGIFADVASGEWYADSVVWAADKGIINGYGDGNFGPQDEVTREQLVAMLYRYAQSKGLDVSASADLSGCADYADISDYAKEAMGWAVEKGILKGYENDVLAPGAFATRGEIALIFQRFVELFPDEIIA